MSGHSKWSSIKRKKGANDAKRGKIFTQLIREITAAARTGGSDPDANPRLRLAIDKARAQNMPKDNIERAVARGGGGTDSDQFEEVRYEGYGPSGAAVIVDALTDNRNRTVGEVRHLFSKYGGNLGASGCVSFLFERRGVLVFDVDDAAAEALIEAAIEADALDVSEEACSVEVVTEPDAFDRMRDLLSRLGEPASAELQMVPQSTVELVGNDAQNMLRLMEALDDHDDVSHVHANFDVPDEELERLA